MLHKIISTFGLGILGVDPFTAIYLLSMGLRKEKKEISGSWLKYLTTGFIFALTCFTDPTYYAVILIGGESHNFFLAAMLLTVWFTVSQFMAIIVYFAIELNLLKKLTETIDHLKQRNLKSLSYILYGVLILVAVALLVDTGCYLIVGKYLL